MKNVIFVVFFSLFAFSHSHLIADVNKGATYAIFNTVESGIDWGQENRESYFLTGEYQPNNHLYDNLLCQDGFDPSIRIVYRNHVLAIEYRRGDEDFFTGWGSSIKSKRSIPVHLDFFYLERDFVDVRVRLLNLETLTFEEALLNKKAEIKKGTLVTENGSAPWGPGSFMRLLKESALSSKLHNMFSLFIGDDILKERQFSRHGLDYFKGYFKVLDQEGLDKYGIKPYIESSLITPGSSIQLTSLLKPSGSDFIGPDEVFSGFVKGFGLLYIRNEFKPYEKTGGEYFNKVFLYDENNRELTMVGFPFKKINKIFEKNGLLVIQQQVETPMFWRQKYEYVIVSREQI